MTGQPLFLDIWRLIFEHVDRETLYDVCLTCKSFNPIATPILYRTISLIASEPNRMGHLPWHKREEEPVKNSPLRRHWYLLSRLEEEGNDTLRNYVQRLDLSTSLGPGQLDQRFLKHLLEDGRLPRLIGRLPNLRRVTINVEELQTEEVIRAIAEHTRKPELSLKTYIDGENTFYQDQDQPLPLPLPCITCLQLSLNPFDQHNAENRCVPAAQRLIFNSPNLRSLSLTLWWRYGGCVVSLPQYPVTTSFQFTGNEVFPLIEELSLDGYGNRMRDDEWAHWRERFDWSKLRSLTLGPQDASGVLDRFAGYATALTSLEVRAYVGERSENRTGLEALLCAFGSLRTLKLEGYICSVEAVAQHKGLEELWLHEDELASAAKERRVLTADDLEYLDKECPRLKTLKVDIKRGDDELPIDFLSKLATGFRNLKSLSLHFELGLPDTKHPITPTINYTSVHSIAQSFFNERKQSGLNTDTFTLALWTGSSHRRWPQWEPPYVSFEKLYTTTYEIRLRADAEKDGGEVHVRHLEREELESRDSKPGTNRSTFGGALYETMPLRKRVEAAVEGPPTDVDDAAPVGLGARAGAGFSVLAGVNGRVSSPFGRPLGK
ncbi:hypothetical protein BJX66DRAFT_85355 [Aspergillus keveii]|uniref:F-box domain protein n=1 Tax=Aspergillus keveii TaxID=714993 RepID=A0ABR4FMK4_9EURO